MITRKRCAFTLVELLVVAAIIALLIAILLPALRRGHEQARQTACAANQRGIGQGLLAYLNENAQRYPLHYVEPKYAADPNSVSHEIRWAGMMGSTDRLKISEQTSSDVSPDASHPSRALFLLAIERLAMPGQFICPSTEDEVDDLHNRGGDCPDSACECRAEPGIDRFDFRGMTYLSYGYQLPYGPHAAPSAGSDPMMPLLADRSPYSRAIQALNDTKTDRRACKGPCDGLTIADLREWTRDEWRPYNSPNHQGDGQNVLFADGHLKWSRNPMVGLKEDNIYRIQAVGARSETTRLLGYLPNSHDYGPQNETDTLLVP